MEILPVRSTRIYEEIVRQIKALITEGKLRSGDQLPPERELAAEFKVSRTSVREALRTLESIGLIQIRPGGGTFVRDVSVASLMETLQTPGRPKRSHQDHLRVLRAIKTRNHRMSHRAMLDHLNTIERLMTGLTRSRKKRGTTSRPRPRR